MSKGDFLKLACIGNNFMIWSRIAFLFAVAVDSV
jgi:hypothetical protein